MAFEKQARQPGQHLRMKRAAVVGVLSALLTVLILFGLVVTARAVCTPFGTSTSNLGLCQPGAGELNWTAAINANWAILDGLFTGSADQLLGVKHTGTGAELKTLIAGSGIGITYAAGTVTLANTGGLAAIGRSYLGGCGMANDGSLPNTVLDIGGCMTASDDQSTLMNQTNAYTKSVSAWAVGTGNGGLDTGSIATSTVYHVFQIERTDTQVVDYLFSTSPSSPSMPANYTKKRRLGSFLTDGAAHIILFAQYGDEFYWSTPPALDVNVTNPGTSAVTRTLTVPTGVQVLAIMEVAWQGSATSEASVIYLSSLDTADVAASATASPLGLGGTETGTLGPISMARVWTNTSGQIRSRASSSSGNNTLRIQTLGWLDTRGRNN